MADDATDNTKHTLQDSDKAAIEQQGTLARTMRDMADAFERGNERARGTRIEVIATTVDGHRYGTGFVVDDSILDGDGVAVAYLRECIRAVLEPVRRHAQVMPVRELTPVAPEPIGSDTVSSITKARKAKGLS